MKNIFQAARDKSKKTTSRTRFCLWCTSKYDMARGRRGCCSETCLKHMEESKKEKRGSVVFVEKVSKKFGL